MWIKIDDNLPDHPKIVAAGPEAAWLYVCGLCFCNRFLTDGFIPERQVRRLADIDKPLELAERLIYVGLWEQADGGYLVHDYLEHQNGKSEIEASREARARAGSLGGFAKASKRLANARALPKTISSKSVPEEEEEIEEEIEVYKEKEKEKEKPRRQAAHPLPPDFDVTDEMFNKARSKYPDLDIDRATEQWRDAMLAKGFEYKDWQAAWRSGMARADQWTKEHKGGNGDDSTKFGRAVIRAGREIAGAQLEQVHRSANGRAHEDYSEPNLFRLPEPKTHPRSG